MDFETLSRWADEEIKSVVKILPADIQAAAKICSLHFEERPGSGEFDSELEGNELGLFEGATAMDEPDPGAMPSIRIFVTNIWEWTEKDEQDFRDEVGTTFLHELGHYLGWDEDEVADRGLE